MSPSPNERLLADVEAGLSCGVLPSQRTVERLIAIIRRQNRQRERVLTACDRHDNDEQFRSIEVDVVRKYLGEAPIYPSSPRCICGPDRTGENPDCREECPVHGVHYGPAKPHVDTTEAPF